jgi:amino acid adenylation domain-containing protein
MTTQPRDGVSVCGTALAALRGPSVHELFERQADASPDATALLFEGRAISYARLNERANRLAHRLIRLGVGSGTVVGLCADRSIDLVVGILGILKAGGAYLPLDPASPPARLAYMLADGGAPVVLTQRHLVGRLPNGRTPTLSLDEPGDGHDPDDGRNPEYRAGGTDPAYVIYTSGSTGAPKGVVVTHANVVRLFRATDHWFRFGPDDVWTLFHSFAFDFSVWELWGALLYGGRLVIVPYTTSRSPQDFYRLLRDHRVTVLNQTPSAFRQLIRAEETVGTAGDLALRLVIFGGESLDVQALRPWFERHGDESPRLVNMYGITETTVHVTYRPLTRADLAAGFKGSPIGVPIPDLRVHVLDENLRPVPPGEPGEMFVGGAGVATGYLNRHELTAGRFVRDPFSADPSARLYRSGDLARTLPDGQLEFLGRADSQVKIRGFRIELGEIEAAMSRHPSVGESVVIAREDVTGERRLVAYIAARAGHTVEPHALRAALKEVLPEYMVPAAVVVLDALPLTANGKIDRAALPAPEGRDRAGAAPTDPSGDWERRVRGVWARILRCEVGLDDNFFDLGGNSLHLAEVQAELEKLLGRACPVTDLFEYTTVRTLAARLGGDKHDPARFASEERARLQRNAFARRRPVKGGGV